MPTVPALGTNALVEENRDRIELDDRPKFSLGYNAYSLRRRFFESDDAARNVPPGSIELVAPPGEQRSSGIVLDQQVDVDQRRGPAKKEKYLVGQPVCLAAEPGFELSD